MHSSLAESVIVPICNPGGMYVKDIPPEIPDHRTIAITDAKHGRFKYYKHDEWLGQSLEVYGEWSEDEVELFKQCLRPGDIALDVGANIGAFSVPMARLVGKDGRVLAFEPYPETVKLLKDNLRLNAIQNVTVVPFAAMDTARSAYMPSLDGPRLPGGFSVEEEGDVQIETIRIDDLDLAKVDFIKIDAEGTEKSVLEGARETIKRCRPIIYAEADRIEKAPDLISYLTGIEYRLYWHRSSLFNPKNFRGVSKNIYGGTVSQMILAVPEEANILVEKLDEVADLRPDDDQTYQREIKRYERICERNPSDLGARVLAAHYANLIQDEAKADKLIAENLKIDPDHFGTLVIRGLMRLQRGDYERGWQDYELRYRKENSAMFGNRPHDGEQWDGKPTDEPLLIWNEQGFGDSIMFGRFMADVLKRAPNAFMEVQPQLYELFEFSKISPNGLYRSGRELPHYAQHCSIPSLMATLGLGGDLARPVPYLFAPPKLREAWRRRLNPKIGLCWKGSPRSERPYSRDISIDLLRPITKGRAPLSLNNTEQFTDFADTAAAISELDLIITVDTSIAHLAGALGKPVWLMLSFDPDFRWGLTGSTTVWYPTMRIFRQKRIFDWTNVVEDMTAALAEFEGDVAA